MVAGISTFESAQKVEAGDLSSDVIALNYYGI